MKAIAEAAKKEWLESLNFFVVLIGVLSLVLAGIDADQNVLLSYPYWSLGICAGVSIFLNSRWLLEKIIVREQKCLARSLDRLFDQYRQSGGGSYLQSELAEVAGLVTALLCKRTFLVRRYFDVGANKHSADGGKAQAEQLVALIQGIESVLATLEETLTLQLSEAIDVASGHTTLVDIADRVRRQVVEQNERLSAAYKDIDRDLKRTVLP